MVVASTSRGVITLISLALLKSCSEYCAHFLAPLVLEKKNDKLQQVQWRTNLVGRARDTQEETEGLGFDRHEKNQLGRYLTAVFNYLMEEL